MTEALKRLFALSYLHQGEGLPIEALVQYLGILNELSRYSPSVIIINLKFPLLVFTFSQGALNLGVPRANDFEVLELVAMSRLQKDFITQVDDLGVFFEFHVTENRVHQSRDFLVVGFLVDFLR